MDSIEKLLDYRFEWVLAGHGDRIRLSPDEMTEAHSWSGAGPRMPVGRPSHFLMAGREIGRQWLILKSGVILSAMWRRPAARCIPSCAGSIATCFPSAVRCGSPICRR